MDDEKKAWGQEEKKRWAQKEMARLDAIRSLLDEAHARANELLDEAQSTRLTLDPEGAQIWKRIKADQKKDQKKDNILLHMADAVLGERAARCKAERLAMLLGQCVGRVRRKGVKEALESEFPDWKKLLKEYEERRAGGDTDQ